METVFERMKNKGYASQKKLNDEEKNLYKSRYNNLGKRTDQDIEK